VTDGGTKLRLVDSPVAPDALAALGDDDLMLLSRQGRKDAFEVLIVRHQGFVLGCASRFFADRQLGREVAQDVFLALWAEKERYRPRGRFKSLLVAMTFNRCRIVARQKQSDSRKLELAKRDALPPPGQTPLAEILERSRAELVREKLALLPPAMRRALILRYAQGLSLAEIASLTGKPLGTIKSDLSRGLEKLKAALSGEEP
jgi:RNA polymerase sigma-70 factor, ECF subfamily